MVLHIVWFQVKKVPLLLEDLPVLITQGIRSFTFPSDDGVRTLPVGPELSLILLSCSLNNAL